MAEADPLISVALIVGNRRARAARALASVLAQEGIERAEVILVDAGDPDLPPLDGSDHPRVRLLRRERVPYGELRAECVRLARGAVVAFLEEHAAALPGWLRAIVNACNGPWAGAGGEVHNLNPGVGVSDAVALMNFWRWRPPARWQESVLVPGHNSAYKREVLLAYGEALGKLLESEVVLNWKLAAAGQRLVLDPAIKFTHLNETGLRAICRGYYLWDRCFGHERAKGWSRPRRLLRALVTPLTPAKRLATMFVFLLRHQRHDLGIYFRQLPAMLVAQCCSAAGMAMGMLFGRGDAPHRFVDYELDAFRETVGPASR